MRGLSVWIRGRIVTGELHEAREGILVGLACARHVSRSPFLITSLAASSYANEMLDRLEELIQHPECPNLYWPLTALPRPLIDIRPAFEFEREFMQRSVDGLNEPDRPRTAEEWEALAERTIAYILPKPDADDAAGEGEGAGRSTRRAMTLWAKRDLPRRQPSVSADQAAAMSEGEVVVRWLVARRIEFCDRALAAISLDPPQSLERLRARDAENIRFVEQWGLNLQIFFAQEHSAWTYVSLSRFERRVAALRVVEGIRHYAATHDGELPVSLSDVSETPLPNDPLTGIPFHYKRLDDQATFHLSASRIEVSRPGFAESDLDHEIGLTIKVAR